MPWDEVMGKFKRGELHSGSDKGPPVKSRQQAIAIMMSEKKKAGEDKKEYMVHADGGDVTPPGGIAFDQNMDRMPPLNVHREIPHTTSGRGLPPLNRHRTIPDTAGDRPDLPPRNVHRTLLPETANFKKGGPMKRYDDGGTVDVKSSGIPSGPKNLPTPMREPPQDYMRGTPNKPSPKPTLSLPIVKSQGKGTLIVEDKGKEEWEPQGRWGENTTNQPIQRTPPPHGGATGAWKKGGPMKRYDDGGPVSGDVRSPEVMPSTAGKIPTASQPSSSAAPKPSPPRPPKPSGGKGSGISVIDVGHSQDTSPVQAPAMVQAKRGGPIAHKKGGEVCASNAKQFKQNLAETAVNQTEKMALAKGGEVAWKKPSWRRW